MASTEEWPQIVPREARVINNPGSWHNPTGEPLRQLSENLWVMERGYVDTKMDYGGKATIIRLPDRRLFVHCCLPLDRELKAKIDSLGTVSAVVSGNTQHVDFIKCWKHYYPDATFIAAPGHREKRPELPFDAELNTDGTPHDAYKDDAGTIRQVYLEGCPVMSETVFFHVPSKTMMCSDVIFTLPRKIPFMTRVGKCVLNCMIKPIIWVFYVKDKQAYRRSLEKVVAWDFETMVPCHGEIIQENAVAVLKKSYGLK